MQALPDSLIVLTAHVPLQESADVAYPFRQDSNFWYLTGLNEPNLVVVINTKTAKSILLTKPQNDYQKEWDGASNQDSLAETSGIDEIRERTNLVSILRDAKKQGLHICTIPAASEIVEPYGFYSNPARKVLIEDIKKVEANPKDIRLVIARLRQIKQPAELDAIREAIRITGETLQEVKARLSDFENEKDIERAITAGFFAHGSDGHAYEPIVACGKNASIIHYNDNNQALLDGSLLLLDVGAKVAGYAADISRTWAYGDATDRQKQIFNTVVELQDRALDMVKSGMDIRNYQEKMEVHALKAAKKLGFTLKSYPHGFSHFLGLDVHDAGDYNAPIPVGSVITVEPGLYFESEDIGVRIEDNILITENGIENLSKHISRTL